MKAIGAHPALLRVVSVTLVHANAQFTLFSYLVVAYRDTLGVSPPGLTALLSLNGLAGFVGNLAAGRIADRRGPALVIHAALLATASAFVPWIALFAVGSGPVGIAIAIVAAILWGAGNFASNSMQQVRLVNLAPTLSSVALDASAIYLGQFVGAAVGGPVLAHAGTDPASLALPWVGLPLFFVAIGVSVVAQRRIERLPVAVT